MNVYQSADGSWVWFDGQEKRRFTTEGEAMSAAREQKVYSEVRAAARDLWNAMAKLRDLQREYTALDYGTTLDAGTGENAGLTAASVGAVVFDTTNAIDGLLAQGHATNLAKLL